MPEERPPSDDHVASQEASAAEEAELRRLRKAIAERSSRRLWQLVPKRTLSKALWLILVLVAILWLRRNAGRLAAEFDGAWTTSPTDTRR